MLSGRIRHFRWTTFDFSYLEFIIQYWSIASGDYGLLPGNTFLVSVSLSVFSEINDK